jgi:hypothetical protein
MKKVLIISPFYNGLFKYTRPLYEELKKEYKGKFLFHHIGNSDMTFDIDKIKKIVNQLCDEIIKYNPDIIHYNYGTYDVEQLIPYYLKERGFKCYQILTYHSLQLDIFKKINKPDYDKIVNDMMGTMDAYVFFTKYAKKVFEEKYGFKPKKYVVAYHPATHLEIHLSKKKTMEYDKEFNIKRDKPIATLLGYPSHWKDSVPVLKLIKEFPNVNFVVGGPWWKEKFTKENPNDDIDSYKNLIIINKELNQDEFNYAMDLGVGLFPYKYFPSFQGSGLLPNYMYRGINTLVNDFEPMKEYRKKVVNFYDDKELFRGFKKVIDNMCVEKDLSFGYNIHAEKIVKLYMGD